MPLFGTVKLRLSLNNKHTDMANSQNKLKDFLYTPIPMTATDWLVDCVIALGAFGFGLVQLTLSSNLFVPDPFTQMILGIHEVGPRPFEVLATFLICVPLVFRRRLPWPSFILTIALWVIFDAGFSVSALSMVPVLVSLFTVAYEKGDTQTLAAGATSLAVIAFAQLISHSNSLNSLLLFQNTCMVIAVAFAGNALYARQGRMSAMEAQAKEMERASEAEASKRVEEERVRIARELHDITAHSLSAVSIQAAAAGRLIDTDTVAAKDAIEEVRSTAKGALEDMRAMVGVLRRGEDTELEPTEGTDRMATLESYLEGAGIDCDLLMSGYNRNNVPTHVDVALFGIAREACTNIVKHAKATKAVIDLRDLDDMIMMYVYDNGRGIGDSAENSEGHGIEGMRERVKLLSGEFRIDQVPEGGSCVRVAIPATWKER